MQRKFIVGDFVSAHVISAISHETDWVIVKQSMHLSKKTISFIVVGYVPTNGTGLLLATTRGRVYVPYFGLNRSPQVKIISRRNEHRV